MNSMKVAAIFLLSIILLAGCSTPKKAAPKPAGPTVTKNDRLLGGTSFSSALVIMVKTESEGLKEEYRWLSNSYPGYGLVRRTQVARSGKHYDVVRIKTRQGALKDVYFDSTAFFGRP